MPGSSMSPRCAARPHGPGRAAGGPRRGGPGRPARPLDLDRVVIGPHAVDAPWPMSSPRQLARRGRPDRVGRRARRHDPDRAGGHGPRALVEPAPGRFGGEREVRRGAAWTPRCTSTTRPWTPRPVPPPTSAVVSVGGGTITDIAKVATGRCGAGPAGTGAAQETAGQAAASPRGRADRASVDGYTDNVSVVLRDGVKPQSSRWPDVVVASATRRGAGSSTPPGTAGAVDVHPPADWYLASAFGLDASYTAAATCSWRSARARGLVARRGTAGSRSRRAAHPCSRPRNRHRRCRHDRLLSGVEHVVSHMLDMHHDAHGLDRAPRRAGRCRLGRRGGSGLEHLFATFDPAAPGVP